VARNPLKIDLMNNTFYYNFIFRVPVPINLRKLVSYSNLWVQNQMTFLRTVKINLCHLRQSQNLLLNQ